MFVKGLKFVSSLHSARRGLTGHVAHLRALESFSASYRQGAADCLGYNVCVDCLSASHLAIEPESRELDAYGLCAGCGHIKRVYDLDLLRLYRAYGLQKTTIKAHMPLLRQDFPSRPLICEASILDRLQEALAPEQNHAGAMQ